MSTTDDDAHRLALSQTEHHTAAAYDALRAVSALALTDEEIAMLVEARAKAGELHRSIAARRAERRVAMATAERAAEASNNEEQR